jgi:hypothetical protein
MGLASGGGGHPSPNSYEASVCQETNRSEERTFVVFFRRGNASVVSSRSGVLT